MLTRKRLRNWLSVLSFIAFFLAVQPFARAFAGITPTPAQAAHLKEHPEDLPRTGDYVFGWSHSPLVSYHDEYTLRDEGGRITAGHVTRMHIGWLSWSSLTLAVAIVLFGIATWLDKRLLPVPEVTTSSARAGTGPRTLGSTP
ncbi:hypothetical protein J8F10_10305 [Gemmata sp. G18]|uniref:PepSY domain-containing protein n=1 Tax=Gemmata palustris TaxID=2822762 RepID=A0ABS5BPL6_9BACT|nr:hypothetical protein [Gemmata palustris]MBP3955672.1 hypothetical protein [Gemmata palustris]